MSAISETERHKLRGSAARQYDIHRLRRELLSQDKERKTVRLAASLLFLLAKECLIPKPETDIKKPPFVHRLKLIREHGEPVKLFARQLFESLAEPEIRQRSTNGGNRAAEATASYSNSPILGNKLMRIKTEGLICQNPPRIIDLRGERYSVPGWTLRR